MGQFCEVEVIESGRTVSAAGIKQFRCFYLGLKIDFECFPFSLSPSREFHSVTAS